MKPIDPRPKFVTLDLYGTLTHFTIGATIPDMSGSGEGGRS
ncbi:MAG: hypothetical protein OXD35_00160 [Thiotrichales bacterium]|nr:hypothetical protein [Thiotrichales bacterium]